MKWWVIGNLYFSFSHWFFVHFVLERPKFQLSPMNITAYEEQSVMLHCVATGDPRPTIYWDKHQLQETWDPNRFTVCTVSMAAITCYLKLWWLCLQTCTANSMKFKRFARLQRLFIVLKSHCLLYSLCCCITCSGFVLHVFILHLAYHRILENKICCKNEHMPNSCNYNVKSI